MLSYGPWIDFLEVPNNTLFQNEEGVVGVKYDDWEVRTVNQENVNMGLLCRVIDLPAVAFDELPIKPCPFCGIRPNFVNSGKIACQSKHCKIHPSTPQQSSTAQAIKAWNERTNL